MCGITAIYAERNGVSPEALGRATRALAHRGPDAEHCWIAPDRHVGLGHRHLGVGGHRSDDQPLVDEEGRLRLVMDGALCGLEGLRAGITARGYRFRTGSDYEIALPLYREYGASCVHRLRGKFAFVLWDETNHVLLAARDRFGGKPLFWARHEGALYLASEAKALFAAGVPARWDRESLFHLLGASLRLPTRTLFAQVYQVPPGHYLLASDDEIEIVPYWDLRYPPAEATAAGPPGAGAPFEESVERVRGALHAAVRLRLRTDEPIGCCLSGGLDSCAVLGVAATQSRRPLRAFTITFDQPEYDESGLAREAAARAGAEFIPVRVRSADLAEHFTDALRHGETLVANAHAVAMYLLSRAVRDAGCRVVLTGHGADEVFAGYPHFRRDMLLYNTPGQGAEARRRLLGDIEAGSALSRGLLSVGRTESIPLPGVERALGFVPSFLEVSALTGQEIAGLLHPDFLAPFRGRDPFRRLLDGLDAPERLAGREPVHQSIYLWSKTVFPNYILSVLGDRAEMAHGIESRLPFMDQDLVELAAGMPAAHKIRGVTEKYVLREATRSVLPDAVYERREHPFVAPLAVSEPEGPLFTLLQDTLRGSALAATGVFDRRKVLALLDGLPGLDPATRGRMDHVLMMVLSACLLHACFRL